MKMRTTSSPVRSLLAAASLATLLTATTAFAQQPKPLGSDLVIGKAGEFGHFSRMGMLLNNGSGFDRTIAQLPGFTGSEVSVADLNGDNADDIIVVQHTGQVYVALSGVADFSNGIQSSDLVQVATVPELSGNCCERTRAFRLADVNGDGKMDIVTTQWAKLTAMLGNGNGTFAAAQVSPMANFDSRGLAVGDVTGDGIADAVVTNAVGNWSLWLHKGNGNGTFAAPAYIANSQLAVPNNFLGDADGDGDLDIYTGSFNSQYKVFVNNGGGNFTMTNVGGGTGIMLIAEDMNGDDKVDLVVTGAGSQLTVDNGGVVTSYPISLNPRHGTVGDFNKDGVADLAVVATEIYGGAAHEGELWILHGNANGTFTPLHIDNFRNNFTIAAGTFGAPSDTTPPSITPTVSGSLNNGWYTSNVTISWAVADAESAITSSTGCAATTVSTDTAGTTFTCSATSGGGTSSQSVTIKRDTTGPSIASATPSTSALWPANNKMVAVTVSVSASDAGSGGVVCSINSVTSSEGGSAHEPDVELTGPLTLNLRAEREGKGPGRAYTAQISCKDAAGNTSTATATVSVPHDQGRK